MPQLEVKATTKNNQPVHIQRGIGTAQNQKYTHTKYCEINVEPCDHRNTELCTCFTTKLLETTIVMTQWVLQRLHCLLLVYSTRMT